MAIAFDKLVGEAEGEITSATQTVTVASGGVAAGNLVIVGTINNAGVPASADVLVSVTDARGNTYSLSSQLLGSAQNDVRTCVGWSVLGTALQAGDLITATWTNSVFAGLALVAVAYSGIAASPLDQSGTAQDDGFPQSQPVGPSLTTTQDDELLISWIGTQNVRTFSAPTTGWTARGTLAPGGDYGYLFEERIVSSINTYNSAPTLSADDYWNAHTLTFKAALSARHVTIPRVISGVGRW